MNIPPAIQTILSDQADSSEFLLERLIVAYENELMNPEGDPESFIALVRTVRQRMQPSTCIGHFSDELILFHESSSRKSQAAYLDLIRNYRESLKQSQQR